jgi:hypothetical protein
MVSTWQHCNPIRSQTALTWHDMQRWLAYSLINNLMMTPCWVETCRWTEWSTSWQLQDRNNKSFAQDWFCFLLNNYGTFREGLLQLEVTCAASGEFRSGVRQHCDCVTGVACCNWCAAPPPDGDSVLGSTRLKFGERQGRSIYVPRSEHVFGRKQQLPPPDKLFLKTQNRNASTNTGAQTECRTCKSHRITAHDVTAFLERLH